MSGSRSVSHRTLNGRPRAIADYQPAPVLPELFSGQDEDR